jgi:hypothetical protein
MQTNFVLLCIFCTCVTVFVWFITNRQRCIDMFLHYLVEHIQKSFSLYLSEQITNTKTKKLWKMETHCVPVYTLCTPVHSCNCVTVICILKHFENHALDLFVLMLFSWTFWGQYYIEKSSRYSQTCVNGHLRTTATCQQRPSGSPKHPKPIGVL